MPIIKNILNVIKIIVFPIIIIFLTLFLCSKGIVTNYYFRLLFVFCDLCLIFLSYSFFVLEKNILLKFFLCFIYVNTLFFLCYGLIETYDLFKYLTSVVYIKNLILKSGGKGAIVFVLIQVLEVVCLPIPTIVIIIVGTLIYGPFLCFLLCSLGVFLGSIVSFMIGKTFGLKLANWFFGKSKMEKYMTLIDKNGKFILFVAFLLPFFPDDILCVVAGISKMKLKDFALITILTKPIGIFIASFFGTGFIIPFKGWGIYFWIILIVVVMMAFLFLITNKKKLQNLFKK